MAKWGESCNRCPRLKIVAKALNPIDKAWWWAGWNRMEIISRRFRFRDLVWSQLHEMDFFLLNLSYGFECRVPVSIVVWLYILYLVPNELVRFLLILVGLFASFSSFSMGFVSNWSILILHLSHHLSLSTSHHHRQGVLGVGWWDVECEDDVPPWNEVLRAVGLTWFSRRLVSTYGKMLASCTNNAPWNILYHIYIFIIFIYPVSLKGALFSVCDVAVSRVKMCWYL